MRQIPSLLLLLSLAACAAAPQPYEPPALDFSGRTPIRLAVAEQRVERAPVVQAQAQGGLHGLPVPLATAVETLLRARLQATGGADYLRAVVEEASVREEAL